MQWKKIWTLAQALSLDVVLAALGCQEMIRWILDVAVPFNERVLLAAAVWLIYTADHLIDSWQTSMATPISRRTFHIQYRKELLIASAILVTGILPLLWHLDPRVFWYGAYLSIIVVFYYTGLWIYRYLWFIKEIFTAAVFVAGTGLSAWVRAETVSYGQGALISALFFAAWLNLTMFSWYERKEDRVHRLANVTIAWQYWHYLLFSTVLFFASTGAAVIAIVIWANRWPASLLIALIGLVQFVLVLFPNHFRKNRRYRSLGDGAFMLTLTSFLWH